MSGMKAAVVTGFAQPLELREAEKPASTAGRIVVKVEACGVCPTDLHAVPTASLSPPCPTAPSRRLWACWHLAAR